MAIRQFALKLKFKLSIEKLWSLPHSTQVRSTLMIPNKMSAIKKFSSLPLSSYYFITTCLFSQQQLKMIAFLIKNQPMQSQELKTFSNYYFLEAVWSFSRNQTRRASYSVVFTKIMTYRLYDSFWKLCKLSASAPGKHIVPYFIINVTIIHKMLQTIHKNKIK